MDCSPFEKFSGYLTHEMLGLFHVQEKKLLSFNFIKVLIEIH